MASRTNLESSVGVNAKNLATANPAPRTQNTTGTYLTGYPGRDVAELLTFGVFPGQQSKLEKRSYSVAAS